MKLADLLITVGPTSAPVDRSVPEAQSAAPYSPHQTVHDLFRARVRATPNAVAVGSPDAQLTYAQLDWQSDQLALMFLKHGVQSEEFVLLLMNRSPRIVVAMLAVLKAGATYVPILPTDPLERIQYIARDTRSRILISEASLRDLVGSVRQATPNRATIFLFDDGQAFFESTLNETKPETDDSEDMTLLSFDTLAGAADPPAEQASPATLAYVMYTSGTSGRPKGVMIAHRSIVRLVIEAGYIKIGTDDRILQTGSLAFDAATFEIWGALLNGGLVYLAPRDVFLRPDVLKSVIQRERITILFLTTALFNQLTDESNDIFVGVRVLLTGGERVSAGHISRVRRLYPELELLHVYGPTENTTFSTAFRVEREFELDVPIGLPIGHSTVSVLSTDLRQQSGGVLGELCTGGYGLARGYLNDAAMTAEKFIPDSTGNGTRVYRTGDLVRWSGEYGPEPVLEFCGRIDDQVKVRGFRVEPGEIEACLREINGVRDATVVAQSPEHGSSSLIAYLVGDAGLDAKMIRRFCRETLPDYMVPSDFVVLDHFPLNVNGKIDRNALPSPNRETGRADPSIPASTKSTLIQLRAIWEEVLHRSDFDEDDDFFDLGGHSLTAVQMISLVAERMQVELPIDAVFDAPTLRALTQYLLDSARFGVAALDDGMVLMSGEPQHGALFAFPPGMADCLGYSELARALEPFAFYGFTFLEGDDRIVQYADLIQSTPATEPYLLFGYSSGGNLAYHVARELESRGKRVASLIMLDSARHLAELHIPFEKITQVTNNFLSSDSAKVYLTSAVLRDKAFRNIARNLEYVSRCIDAHTVKANIHLVGCENSEDVHTDDAGNTLVSKPAWEVATTGRFLRYQGAGGHDYMLHPPHFERNAALIRAIIEGRVEPNPKPADISAETALPVPPARETEDELAVFERLESRVRSYCRSFPTVFERAQGAWLYGRDGKSYIDFFCGAGSLNYGHNPPAIKRALLDYLESDGVAHALDMATVAKERFLIEFELTILRPRNLDYLVQFVGPTGANGVEASLKLARKIKRRSTIVAFTNGYHGLSSGALSVTANAFYRDQSYTQRSNVAFMPFDGYLGGGTDTLDYFEQCLSDPGSGLDRPAAVIVETVQAEGGVNVARVEWLQRLEALCRRFQMLLIIDDIQIGCGRTGTFFSFERAGLSPDIVVLSKSISGFGLPMSLVLLKPDLDIWEAGEHSGTFRGNNLAFVTARAALEFWRDHTMEQTVAARSAILVEELTALASDYPQLEPQVRGAGLIFGLEIQPSSVAKGVVRECFQRGLIMELCGPRSNVLKFLPPLVIEPSVLRQGLGRIRQAIETVLKSAPDVVAVGHKAYNEHTRVA
jgi:diaminobutyrate-2-oxoglutarate transaminase